ncbi:hypothetical protein KBB27_02790 [Patescibacteria group bacterium]|nr:hypothetical protein [Patescibacteria group bacterium]
MEILMRILIGLFVVGVGLFFLFKGEAIIDFLGPIDLFDEHMGSNGTRLAYKLIGTILVIVGFLEMTNLWSAFLGATLGSLIPGRR